MQYIGETISLIVAVSWTATALFAEVASKRIGSQQLNLVRMVLSLLMLSITLWCFTGAPYPLHTNAETWLWLSLSGFVGYVLGDYCLFNSYLLIGSRFGQLFMTLAPPTAAITGWLLLGEQLTMQALLGMLVTLSGIALSVLGKKKEGSHLKVGLKLPLRGILFGMGAGAGQGIGLVLSKVGMVHYEAAIPADAESVSQMLPFASTMIRAIVGAVGFWLVLMYQGKLRSMLPALRDAKAMRAAIGTTTLGPFLGVSLSLMAVQYTEAGIASTLMALTPILIIWPSRWLFKQPVTTKEVIGACISVIGVSLFFL
ncbi:MAG: DMT family transporter [Mediterranea massiliensis]|nr:DMT family transporter [Mediterranea massiliensis]